MNLFWDVSCRAIGETVKRKNRVSQPRLFAFALCVVLFAQLLGAATQLSATIDEPFHITSGYEYLRTGRLQLFDEHAPVAKALFAWPLFLVPDLPPPETAAAYTSGNLIAVTQETLLAYRPLDRVIVAPRIAATFLTLLFAATLYRCAATLAGPTAGLLTLAICAFDPNFIAHGSLATTDMGATTFSFWALWAGTRWLERPTRGRWLLAAALLGLAQGVKLTALLVYPVLGMGVLLNVLLNVKRLRREEASTDFRSLQPIVSFGGMVICSLLVLWALYGFEIRPVAHLLGGLPLPAASHIERWIRLQHNLVYGREAFLLGQNSMHGWPHYFPVAFLIKTPLPLLLLIGLRIINGKGQMANGKWQIAKLTFDVSRLTFDASRFTFYLFPLLYALASLTSPLNIGYRHLLPVLPFLYVWLGEMANSKAWQPRRIIYRSLLVSLLLLWLALNTVSIAPHHLAFFNELAGGPDNGWRFLADSNTDWGQTFKALADYQTTRDLGHVHLSAFTFYDPAAYGVDYIPIAPMTGVPPVLPRRFNPAAGLYAISATTLVGVPLPYPPTFDWFRHRDPFEKIGHAMFLYDVHPLQGTWIAQCSTPVAPLTPEAIEEGFGIPGLRRIAFDCEQSWVLPGGEPGWFARAIPAQTRLRWPTNDALRADLLSAWLRELPLQGLKVSYVQPRPGELPAFAIWECADCALTLPQSPINLDNVLAYRGMHAPSHARPGATVDVVTFWEVLTPPHKPLSIMLHLRDMGGIPIAVGDGLGFPIEQWHSGDIFAQRHQMNIPINAIPGEYLWITNAYLLEDLQPLSMVPFTQYLEIK